MSITRVIERAVRIAACGPQWGGTYPRVILDPAAGSPALSVEPTKRGGSRRVIRVDPRWIACLVADALRTDEYDPASRMLGWDRYHA